MVNAYQLVGTFDSYDAFLTYLSQAGGHESDTYDGKRHITKKFRCSKKRAGCKFQWRALIDNSSHEVKAYSLGIHEHPHDQKGEIRQVIADRVVKNQGAHEVRVALEVRGLPVPSNSQLYNMLAYARHKFTPNAYPTLGDLASLCFDRQYHDGLGDDESFVVDCMFESEEKFSFLLSTRRLLRQAGSSDLLQVDATYKLVWNGHPIFVCGTSDANRKFHALAIALTWDESTEAYERFLMSFRNGVEMVTGTSYEPWYVMGDGARSITGAVASVFPRARRLMCFFHLKKAFREKFSKVAPSDRLAECESDLDILRQAPTDPIFDQVSRLLLEKWNSLGLYELTEYFERQWLRELRYFYFGSAPMKPTTNNGLEATNRVIKKKHTLRKRLPMGVFFTTAGAMARKWSYLLNSVPFAAVPNPPTTKQFTDAWEWLKKSRALVPMNFPNGTAYLVAGKNCNDSVDAYLAPLQGTTVFESWDQFSNWTGCYYRVDTLPGFFTCSCVIGQKKYVCKHSIGVQVKLGILSIPVTAKSVPIGQKRKRGRPARAGPALEFD